MNIFAILREENVSLLDALHRAGHSVWMERSAAVHFRQWNLPIQPVDLIGEPVGFPGVPDNVASLARQAAASAQGVIAAHRQFTFDALLTWTDAPGPQRAAVLAAKSLGIATFEITHGSFNTYRQGHFECDSYVDCILAPGEEEVAFRRFYGCTNRIEITGKPSYDWIVSCDKFTERKAVREKLHLPDRRPLILYAMTWRHPFSTWERDTDLGEATVIEAHMNLQAVMAPYLVIKPHYVALDSVHQIKTMLEGLNVVEYAVTSADPAIILPAVDLLVSHKSSILAEAVLLGIPAIGFDFRERNDHAFHLGKGIEWVDRRADMLPAITRCLLDRPTRDRLAEERETAAVYFNGPNDGQAALRCVAAIERVTKEMRWQQQQSIMVN